MIFSYRLNVWIKQINAVVNEIFLYLFWKISICVHGDMLWHQSCTKFKGLEWLGKKCHATPWMEASDSIATCTETRDVTLPVGKKQTEVWQLYPPHNEVVGGGYILVSLRPSVCPSVCPSVRPASNVCSVASTVQNGFFPYFVQMINSMRGCVVCDDPWPWPISSRSFGLT